MQNKPKSEADDIIDRVAQIEHKKYVWMHKLEIDIKENTGSHPTGASSKMGLKTNDVLLSIAQPKTVVNSKSMQNSNK